MPGIEQQSLPPLGDVRITSPHKNWLYDQQILISGITFVDRLVGTPAWEEEWAAVYDLTRPDTTLVPDPRTTRLCSPEELDHYILGEAETGIDPRHVVTVYRPGREEGEATYQIAQYGDLKTRIFSKTSSPANALTTTHRRPGSPLREGLHDDIGDEFAHRAGYNGGPGDRSFLAVTHSARLLFERSKEELAARREFRERLAQDERLLGSLACLHIPLPPASAYEGWTRHLIHDGSTYVPDNENIPPRNSRESTIIFLRLDVDI
jgi:hypothetical protein